MATRKAKEEQLTPRQRATLDRVRGIDPDATHEQEGEQLFVTYVPKWERGRVADGEFRPNPNPQRLTMYVHTDGKLYGWGFGNETKPPVTLARPITQKSDMTEPLKARAESRKPAKVEEPEPTPEPNAKQPTRKASSSARPATRKTSSRKTGVQVTK
jgi:hypothetical protein